MASSCSSPPPLDKSRLEFLMSELLMDVAASSSAYYYGDEDDEGEGEGEEEEEDRFSIGSESSSNSSRCFLSPSSLSSSSRGEPGGSNCSQFGSNCGGSASRQVSIAWELRCLTKSSAPYRSLIGDMGFIPVLVDLVGRPGPQVHAVTALLNLTLRHERNKERILAVGGVHAIACVLKSGVSVEARENAAALVFSLSCLESRRAFLGEHPDIFAGLVRLLREGSRRAQKDSAAALYNLSSIKANKSRAAHTGAVPPLLQLVENSYSSGGLANESLAVLYNLASHRDGRLALKNESGFWILADLLSGPKTDPSTKEYAIALMLMLVEHDTSFFEDSRISVVYKAVHDLLKTGSDRAKRKAQRFLVLMAGKGVIEPAF